MLIGVVYVSDGDNPRPSSGKRDESHTNQAALIGMKFADEAIKSRATRRSNSTWSSSGSAGCPARKMERRLVMIGVSVPEEGGPVSTIFPSGFFGNCFSANCWPGQPSQEPLENIRLSDELRGTKDELLRVTQALGLEGLVTKRPNSVYESGRRSGAWVKFKITKSQEFAPVRLSTCRRNPKAGGASGLPRPS